MTSHRRHGSKHKGLFIRVGVTGVLLAGLAAWALAGTTGVPTPRSKAPPVRNFPDDAQLTVHSITTTATLAAAPQGGGADPATRFTVTLSNNVAEDECEDGRVVNVSNGTTTVPAAQHAGGPTYRVEVAGSLDNGDWTATVEQKEFGAYPDIHICTGAQSNTIVGNT